MIKGNSKKDMKHNEKIFKWFKKHEKKINTAMKVAITFILAKEILKIIHKKENISELKKEVEQK